MIKEAVKESFVARIWLENGSDGDLTWRGHIRHIQGEEEEYFRGIVEMCDFLGRVSGVTVHSSTSQSHKATRRSASRARKRARQKR